MIFSRLGPRNLRYRSTDRYRYVYFRELIECWYSRRIGSLWKPTLSHVIDVFALTHLVNDLINSFLYVFHYWCLERLWLFMMTVVSLSAFFRFKTDLFFNSFKAITSLRDELFLALIFLIALKGNRRLNQWYPVGINNYRASKLVSHKPIPPGPRLEHMRLVEQEEHSYTLPKEGIQYENCFTLSSGQLPNTGVATTAPSSYKGHFVLLLLEKPDSNCRAQIPFQIDSAASWNTLLSYHLSSMPWAKILTSKTVIPLYDSSPTKQAKHLMCWLYVQTS